MKKVTMTVDFDVEVPDHVDVDGLTLDLLTDAVGVCDENGQVLKEGFVHGYTTTYCEVIK